MRIYREIAARHGSDPLDDLAVDEFFQDVAPTLSKETQQAIFDSLLANDGAPAKIMRPEKLAFLGTSSCMVEVDNGYDPTYYDASKRLHELLADGYTVVVLTSRTKLTNDDNCWRNLVDSENVFMPASVIVASWVHAWNAHDPALWKMWRAAFFKFGLEAPTDDPTLWLNWREAAEAQGVVVY